MPYATCCPDKTPEMEADSEGLFRLASPMPGPVLSVLEQLSTLSSTRLGTSSSVVGKVAHSGLEACLEIVFLLQGPSCFGTRRV
jgi:hypothetical protein